MSSPIVDLSGLGIVAFVDIHQRIHLPNHSSNNRFCILKVSKSLLMKRREILKYTAYITGAAVSAPLISSLLTGCANADGGTSDLQFFDEDSFTLLSDLVDTILPKTDSPSATEMNVHKMIDSMVGTVYKKEDRLDYQKGFQALTSELNDKKSFNKLSTGEKISLLNQLESTTESSLEKARKAYVDLKQQTIAYYLSTETIGKEFLNYLPIPGSYEPCVSLESTGGKAWSL